MSSQENLEQNQPISRRKFLKRVGIAGVGAVVAGTGVAGALGVFGGGGVGSHDTGQDEQVNHISENNPDPQVEQAYRKDPIVQDAIRSGKIEVKNSSDIARFYTAVTLEQANLISNISDIDGEGKVMLPFDLTRSTDLVLGNATEEIDGQRRTVISASNIAAGTEVRSPIAGIFSVTESKIGGIPVYDFKVDRKAFKKGALGRAELAIPATERVQITVPVDNLDFIADRPSVDVGQRITSVRNNQKLQDGSDLIIRVGSSINTSPEDKDFDAKNSLDRLLTYNGKIAFIESLPRIGGKVGGVII